MNKILQICLGLILILLLAYFAFLEVSQKIKDDLLVKTENKLTDKGIVGIKAEVQGEDLGLKRTIILSGTVHSLEEKNKVATLVKNLEGVCGVENKLLVVPRVYTTQVDTVISPVPKQEKSTVTATKKVVTEKVVTEKVLSQKVSIKKISIKKESIKKVLKTESIQPKTNIEKVAVPKVTVSIPSVPKVTQDLPKVTNVISVVELAEVVKEKNQTIKVEGVK